MRRLLALPLVNFDWVMIGLLGLILLKLGVDRVLWRRLGVAASRSDSQSAALEYSPFYHLTIVILVLAEVDWNMFDLTVWTYGYVGVGIVRRGLLSLKVEKDALLNGYSYDLRTIHLLEASKVLAGALVVVSLGLFIAAEVVFAGVNVKIVNLLVFPVLMLLVDSAFLFLSSAASEKDILCYYNQNINEIQPAYKLELVEKITGSSVKVWHFYNLSRLFFRTLLDKMGILDYMWIFSVLNAAFTAMKVLVGSIGKYRSYSKLMKKFDRLFRRSTSAPDQSCTICLTELLNCRQLASCGHLFHYRCLFQWMQTKMECPICRVPIQLS